MEAIFPVPVPLPNRDCHRIGANVRCSASLGTAAKTNPTSGMSMPACLVRGSAPASLRPYEQGAYSIARFWALVYCKYACAVYAIQYLRVR